MALELTLNAESDSESLKFKSSRTACCRYHKYNKRCTDCEEDDQAVVGVGPRAETAEND